MMYAVGDPAFSITLPSFVFKFLRPTSAKTQTQMKWEVLCCRR
jgi:hypothetical protein